MIVSVFAVFVRHRLQFHCLHFAEKGKKEACFEKKEFKKSGITVEANYEKLCGSSVWYCSEFGVLREFCWLIKATPKPRCSKSNIT